MIGFDAFSHSAENEQPLDTSEKTTHNSFKSTIDEDVELARNMYLVSGRKIANPDVFKGKTVEVVNGKGNSKKIKIGDQVWEVVYLNKKTHQLRANQGVQERLRHDQSEGRSYEFLDLDENGQVRRRSQNLRDLEIGPAMSDEEYDRFFNATVASFQNIARNQQNPPSFENLKEKNIEVISSPNFPRREINGDGKKEDVNTKIDALRRQNINGKIQREDEQIAEAEAGKRKKQQRAQEKTELKLDEIRKEQRLNKENDQEAIEKKLFKENPSVKL